MITEYSVLKTLDNHHFAVLNEISSSQEWEDVFDANNLLGCLTDAGLIKVSHYREGNNNENIPVYTITPTGKYRLQQLEEELSREARINSFWKDLNNKLDAQQRESEIQSRLNKRFQIATLIAGILTLIATIVGILVSVCS